MYIHRHLCLYIYIHIQYMNIDSQMKANLALVASSEARTGGQAESLTDNSSSICGWTQRVNT